MCTTLAQDAECCVATLCITVTPRTDRLISMKPVVLVFSGHDPSGGAGQIADVQAITAAGAHPAVVITALTEQDTGNAYAVHPVEAAHVRDAARRVLDDCPIAAVKIGLLPQPDVALAVTELIRGLNCPVVLDPVLVASGGADLADAALVPVLRDTLMPLTTVVTPNAPEAVALTGESGAEPAAMALLDLGAQWALVTGGDTDDDPLANVLAGPREQPMIVTRHWPRRPGRFHGTGCTLAASLAANLALGRSLPQASDDAQRYVDQALARAFTPGRGQAIPAR